MKTTIKNRLMTVLALITLSLVGEASAAGFKLETIVPGYPGYVVVKPELRGVLGGRVRWNASLRCYETDRVERLERVRVTIFATTAGERCRNGAIAGITASNGTAFFQAVNLPYTETRFSVSANPSFDNVHLRAFTTSGSFEMRVPIGRRPR
jgi:hypothetical protein